MACRQAASFGERQHQIDEYCGAQSGEKERTNAKTHSG